MDLLTDAIDYVTNKSDFIKNTHIKIKKLYADINNNPDKLNKYNIRKSQLIEIYEKFISNLKTELKQIYNMRMSILENNKNGHITSQTMVKLYDMNSREMVIQKEIIYYIDIINHIHIMVCIRYLFNNETGTFIDNMFKSIYTYTHQKLNVEKTNNHISTPVTLPTLPTLPTLSTV